MYSSLHSPEKAMATHSSSLAWKIPWTKEPCRLQSKGLWRVRHDWATSLSLFTFMHWKRKWQATPVFLPGESWGRGALWAVIYGVAQSRTRLKWLSSSSSNLILTMYSIQLCEGEINICVLVTVICSFLSQILLIPSDKMSIFQASTLSQAQPLLPELL